MRTRLRGIYQSVWGYVVTSVAFWGAVMFFIFCLLFDKVMRAVERYR